VFEIVWSAAWEMQSPQLLDLCSGELGFVPAP
jgi:hypothetical protein